jgi:uncharacterized cofD-like protein
MTPGRVQTGGREAAAGGRVTGGREAAAGGRVTGGREAAAGGRVQTGGPSSSRGRVVAVGGGHGLARALAALRSLGLAPTAVVTVADDGGSSGRLRRDLGIIAPGDLRMALLTLARNEELSGALAHRFQRGELEGHALGNLFLVALAERADGDFVRALDAAAALLDCQGRVLPSTTEPVQLKGLVEGHEVGGQVRVANAEGRLEAVWTEPNAPAACIEAERAVAEADLVVLGPGSLFTSVIAALLVPDLAAALSRSHATVVYVANLLTQPGETSGFDVAAHVEALFAHVPDVRLDAVVVHDGPAPVGVGEPAVSTVPGDWAGRLILADLAERDPAGIPTGAHDPRRLARALQQLLP